MSTLKNKIAPYTAKGRWYHFFIESDGTAATITTKDLEDVSIVSSTLRLPQGFIPVDFKIGIHCTASNTSTFSTGIKLFANEQQGIAIPGVAVFDYADLWVFGYYGD